MTNSELPSRTDLRTAWTISNGSEVDDLLALIHKAGSEKRFNKPVQKYLETVLEGRDNPLLDIGSNPFYKTYIPEGFKAVTLDWSVKGLPFSGARIVSDAEQLPIADQSFPVVLSKQVYGYLLDPKELVNEMVRVLKSGGLFLLIDVEGEIARYDNLGSKEVPRIWDFCPPEVEAQIRSLGLVDIQAEEIKSWPDFEVAPGVRRDLALTCLKATKL